jgi:polyhydroxyalkanoate synthesis regulator phasin
MSEVNEIEKRAKKALSGCIKPGCWSCAARFAETELTALQSRITELERQVADLTAERDMFRDASESLAGL